MIFLSYREVSIPIFYYSVHDLQIPECDENNVWAIEMFYGQMVLLGLFTLKNNSFILVYVCMQWNDDQHFAHMDRVNKISWFVIWNEQAYG